MQQFDLHTHTTYSDGKNHPEEMVLSAIEKGLTVLGISDHSFTPCDTSYCVLQNKIQSYKDELAMLKVKYADQIELRCGIEMDYFAEDTTEGYDYAIGSVHYVRIPALPFEGTPLSSGCLLYDNDIYIPIDESAEILKTAANTYFSGDIYTLAELYFATVGDVINQTHADIVGHFDLITKFIETSPDLNLDLNQPRYVEAWKSAVKKIMESYSSLNKTPLFEINTGAISRGYRTSPYPSAEIQQYMIELGGKLIYSSDSHSKETLAYQFPLNC